MSKRRSIIRTLFGVWIFDKAKVEIFEKTIVDERFIDLLNRIRREALIDIKKSEEIDKKQIVKDSNLRRKANFFSLYAVTSKFFAEESIKRMKKVIDRIKKVID